MPAAEPVAEQPAPSQPLLLALLAWGIGILADRYGDVPLLFWWCLAALLILISIALRRIGKDHQFAPLLLSALVCVGGGWHQLHWGFAARHELGRFAREASQPVCVEVVAVDRMMWSPAPTSDPLRAMPVGPMGEVLVSITRIRNGRQWQEAAGKCRLRVAGGLVDITAGDRLQVYALLGRVPSALNPGQYDWARAERRAGRYCDLYCRTPECISILEPATASPLGRWLDLLRQRCEWRLKKYVGPENSDLALAVLLGERERLQEITSDAFLKTGTVHLLVVSGLHVGILAFAIWVVVSSGFISRRWGILLTALLVVIYAAIAGGRPPVIRATVLILLGLISLLFARRATIVNLLAVAALVVLIYSPGELFRSGTQLSFLCVAVLAGFGRLVENQKARRQKIQGQQAQHQLKRLIQENAAWYRKMLRWIGYKAGQLILASFCVWVLAAPLVAYHFHIATPLGIAITPIIWPLVAGALIAGFFICAVGWLVPPLGNLLGGICSWCLGTTEWIVQRAVEFDWGCLYCAGPPLWWLWGFYAGLALFALVPRFRIPWPWQISLAALWIACGFVAGGLKNNDSRLTCTFLAIGHGTCVVLELPGNQTILYDAGSLGSPQSASRTIAGYLWSRGITHIDAIVLSHADIDHYNAVPGLIDRFRVGRVYVSPQMFANQADSRQLTAPEFLRDSLEQAAVPIYEVWLGDKLSVAHTDVDIDLLHPPQMGVGGSDNANSILLRVQFDGRTILLPGDLESPGLEEVIASSPQDVDILLAPHHGSIFSDPLNFSAWCTPSWTVVSGRHNDQDFELTEDSYQDVGSQILHTANCGAIQFVLTEKTVKQCRFRH